MSSELLLLIVFGLAGLSLLLLVVLLVVWRMRSVQPAAPPSPPPAVSEAPPTVHTAWTASPEADSPSGLLALLAQLKDLTNSETMAALQQVQASNLHVNVVNSQPQFVVNGVTYSNVDDIPDPALREQTRLLMDKMSSLFAPGEASDLLGSLMNVVSETPSGGDASRAMWVNSSHQQFIYNGKTYNNLDDIPDPELREKVRSALDKLL